MGSVYQHAGYVRTYKMCVQPPMYARRVKQYTRHISIVYPGSMENASIVATGAWVKSKHMYLIRGSVGA